jgi:hypothetical protein
MHDPHIGTMQVAAAREAFPSFEFLEDAAADLRGRRCAACLLVQRRLQAAPLSSCARAQSLGLNEQNACQDAPVWVSTLELPRLFAPPTPPNVLQPPAATFLAVVALLFQFQESQWAVKWRAASSNDVLQEFADPVQEDAGAMQDKANSEQECAVGVQGEAEPVQGMGLLEMQQKCGDRKDECPDVGAPVKAETSSDSSCMAAGHDDASGNGTGDAEDAIAGLWQQAAFFEQHGVEHVLICLLGANSKKSVRCERAALLETSVLVAHLDLVQRLPDACVLLGLQHTASALPTAQVAVQISLEASGIVTAGAPLGRGGAEGNAAEGGRKGPTFKEPRKSIWGRIDAAPAAFGAAIGGAEGAEFGEDVDELDEDTLVNLVQSLAGLLHILQASRSSSGLDKVLQRTQAMQAAETSEGSLQQTNTGRAGNDGVPSCGVDSAQHDVDRVRCANREGRQQGMGESAEQHRGGEEGAVCDRVALLGGGVRLHQEGTHSGTASTEQAHVPTEAIRLGLRRSNEGAAAPENAHRDGGIGAEQRDPGRCVADREGSPRAAGNGPANGGSVHSGHLAVGATADAHLLRSNLLVSACGLGSERAAEGVAEITDFKTGTAGVAGTAGMHPANDDQPKLGAQGKGSVWRLAIAKPFNACSPLALQRGGYERAAVLVQRGGCTFLEKAEAVAAAGGAALVVVNRCNDSCDDVETAFKKAGGKVQLCSPCDGLDTMVAGHPGENLPEGTVPIPAVMVRRGPGLGLAGLLQHEQLLSHASDADAFTPQPFVRVALLPKPVAGCVDGCTDKQVAPGFPSCFVVEAPITILQMYCMTTSFNPVL